MSTIDTGHRDGCAFGRTARCTCTYLTQWDRRPEYTAPAFSGGPDKPAPTFTRSPELQQLHDAALRNSVRPGTLVIPDEMWGDFDFSHVAPGTPEVISASEYRRRKGPERCEHDNGWHWPALVSCKDWDANTLTQPDPEPTSAETYQSRLRAEAHTQAENARHWRRGYWVMAVCAVTGWAFAVARGIWGF